jgi:hypothetical protein
LEIINGFRAAVASSPEGSRIRAVTERKIRPRSSSSNSLSPYSSLSLPQATRGSLNEAVTILKNLRSTSKYALRLREHLTSKELTLVARCIDDVMDADGVQDGFEIYHRTRFRELLGIQAVDLDKTVDQDEEEELF